VLLLKIGDNLSHFSAYMEFRRLYQNFHIDFVEKSRVEIRDRSQGFGTRELQLTKIPITNSNLKSFVPFFIA